MEKTCIACGEPMSVNGFAFGVENVDTGACAHWSCAFGDDAKPKPSPIWDTNGAGV